MKQYRILRENRNKFPAKGIKELFTFYLWTVFICFLQSSSLENLLRQTSQEYGFSPVCFLRWIIRFVLCEKRKPQNSHSWGLSFWCTPCNKKREMIFFVYQFIKILRYDGVRTWVEGLLIKEHRYHIKPDKCYGVQKSSFENQCVFW